MKYVLKIILLFVLLYPNLRLFCWQSPITCTPEWNDASVPWISSDSQNNAMLIWRLFDGDYTRIQVSRYNAMLGTWSDAATISPLTHAREPKVVLNSQGNAIVVWRLAYSTHFVVQASFYNANTQLWDLPFDLPIISNANNDAEMPNVALNDANKAIACWQYYDGAVWRIQSAVRVNSFTWTTPKNLSLPGFYGFSPQIVMNNQVTPFVAIVFYGIMEKGGNDIVQIVTSNNGGSTWTSPVAISSTGARAYVPQIVRDNDDNLLVAWQIKEVDGSWTVQARKRQHGVWQPIKNLTSGIVLNDSRCPNVRIAGNMHGQVCMTWFTSVGNDQQVQATLYDGSDWISWVPRIVNISDTFAPFNRMDWPNQRVAIDEFGNSIIVWQEADQVGNILIYSSVFTMAEGTWLSSILSEPGQDATLPFVALSAQGQGFVAWKRTDGRKLANPINRIQVTQNP